MMIKPNFFSNLSGEDNVSLLSNPLSGNGTRRPWSGVYNVKALTRIAVATILVVLTTALASKIFSLDLIQVDTLSWESLKHKVGAGCPADRVVSVPYPDTIPRTALASYPRSGSSYTRSLVERATGFQTSSIYCDKRLSHFKAECLGLESPFLIKTHYPFSHSRDIDPTVPHWTHYSRAVRIVRNPFDCLWSSFHFSRSGNHSARLDGVDSLSLSVENQRLFLEDAVKDWVEHARYWREDVDIPVHTIRYEDLRINGAETLEQLLGSFVPPNHFPSSQAIACATMDDSSKDPYPSRKGALFSAWGNYDDETRLWILDSVKDEWCRLDFNTLFAQSLSLPNPIDCSTMSVMS